jgi:hypothetical protein
MLKRLAATWPARLGTGLILALLLGDVLSPSAAHAGCGDHLRAVRVGAPQAEPSPLPAAPGEPCTGPNCSRAPQHPPLTPASVKVTLPDLEARLSEPPAGDGFGEPGWLRRSDPAAPIRSSASIFHPPR